MSAFPDKFSYMDGASPVTAALAHRFLKEAFKCRYENGDYQEEWLDEEAKYIIHIINMIQDDIYYLELELYDIHNLFDRDIAMAYHYPPGGGEVFMCNPPGFAIMMSMVLLKKTLFKQLYPNATYAGSEAENTLDDMDVIIDQLNGNTWGDD
jgi:hypothetical protein